MLDAYRELIDELLGSPSAIRKAVAAAGGVSPEGLALIAEMRDRDVLELARLQAMLRETDPYLKPVPDSPGSAAGSFDEIVESLDTARGDLVSLLMNLTLKDWERTATDDAAGEITLAEEVERHVEFDEDHLARIRAVLA